MSDFRDLTRPSHFNDYFNIPSCGIAAQINENKIICFGGWFVQLTDLTNQTFFFSDNDNKTEILDVNRFVVPTNSGFWEPSGIIHNDRLFALQCIQDRCAKGSFYIRVRRVLMFDDNGWEILETTN